MLNIKEKVMVFLEEFYVFNQICAAMIIVDDIQDSELLGHYLATYKPYFQDVKWLFDYQQKKLETVKKELADALVFCMISGEKIQMREMGFALKAYNAQPDIDAEDAEKFIAASFDIYGAVQKEIIKYDEEDAYDRFMKKFFDIAIG